jgi:hypothetical protein
MKLVPLEMPVRKVLYLSQSREAQESLGQNNEVIRLESPIFTHLRENVFLMVSQAVEHTLSQQPSTSSVQWNKVEITQAGNKSDFFLPDVFVHYPDATHKKSFLCGELKYLTVDLGMCFNNNQKFSRKDALYPFEQLYGYMTLNYLRYGFITYGKVIRCLNRVENWL